MFPRIKRTRNMLTETKGARGIQKFRIIQISCERYKSELSIGNEKKCLNKQTINIKLLVTGQLFGERNYNNCNKWRL